MGIIAINVGVTGLVGDAINPRRNTMVTTDNLSVITSPGYLNNQNTGGNPILPTDIFDVLYSFNTNTNQGTYAIFKVSYSVANGYSLVVAIQAGVTSQQVQQNAFNYKVDTGSANAYVVALTPAVTSYTDGLPVSFRATNSNTGASTLSVNGLSAIPILNSALAALTSGAIVATGTYDLIYNSALSSFVAINSSASAGGSSIWVAGTGTNSGIGGDGSAQATGNFSLAYGDAQSGFNNLASGLNSFAFGTSDFNDGTTQATNSYAFAFGHGANAAGLCSFAFGLGLEALGEFSFSFGQGCIASGNFCFAFGNEAQTSDIGSVVWTDSNPAPFPSINTAPNQFNLNFANGYRFFGGSFNVETAGSGLAVAEGSNAKQGIVTLVAGVGVVSNTSVTANSRIIFSPQDANTTGFLTITARTIGSGFTITSSVLSDTGVVAYEIFEPAA